MIQFRWLGVGGVELRVDDQILAIDPYFTRIPLWRMVFGRVRPDHALIADQIPRCDFVLVTHAHVDHLMDVPDVARNTGAVALGSPNTCRLLEASGVPAQQIREIAAGDRLTLGRFRVEVLPADHPTIAGWCPFQYTEKRSGSFSGLLPPDPRPPLRARDYAMDRCFGFLVEIEGQRLLHCPGQAVSAEVLTVKPVWARSRYESLLQGARPRVVIPVHWDAFTRPLSEPIRPMLAPFNIKGSEGALSGQLTSPLRRINLAQFEQMVTQIAPETHVLIPEVSRTYDLRAFR
jgi:L-ascorbate metabolism protein UlaG (beta-lactamase superfamily)